MCEVNTIHIGLHKTATTYLQKKGLKSHPDITLLHLKKDLPEHWADFIAGKHIYKFKTELQELVKSFANNSHVVLSGERLSGDMHHEGAAYAVAENLNRLFPKAKIVVTLREPYSYIESAYCHYIREGGTLSMGDYLTHPSSPAQSHRYSTIIDKVCYFDYIEYLSNIFENRLHVLFFEDLCLDHFSFMSSLFEIIGVKSISISNENIVPTGQKLKYSQTYWIRLLNYLSDTLHNRPYLKIPCLYTYSKARRAYLSFIINNVRESSYFHKPIDPFFPPEWHQRIIHSNYQLSLLLGRDLSEIGYTETSKN